MTIPKKTINDLYKDGAKKSVKIVGDNLAKVAALFAEPVGKMAEITKRNLMMYIEKLEKEDIHNIVSPDLRIAAPIYEKIRYIEDEKVADYYTEILKKASLKNKKNSVSISFIEILNRLTADELKILEFIYDGKYCFKLTDEKISKNDEKEKIIFTPNDKDEYCLGPMIKGIPIINVKQIYENGNFIKLVEKYTILDILLGIKIDEMNLYFDNLLSLGLIAIKHDEAYTKDFLYYDIENSEYIKNIAKKVLKNKIKKERGILSITRMGMKLIEISRK